MKRQCLCFQKRINIFESILIVPLVHCLGQNQKFHVFSKRVQVVSMSFIKRIWGRAVFVQAVAILRISAFERLSLTVDHESLRNCSPVLRRQIPLHFPNCENLAVWEKTGFRCSRFAGTALIKSHKICPWDYGF